MYSVRIDTLDEQGRATYVEGKFSVRGQELSFKGIAMEGYGGPNFSAILPESTLDSLRTGGFEKDDIDEITVEIQRKVMEGEVAMKTRAPAGNGDEATRNTTANG